MGIHCGQYFGRYMFDLFSYQSFAASDIEVLTIKPIVGPHKLGELFYLGVVLRAHDSIDVQAKTVLVLILQRIKRANTVEGLLPIPRHSTNPVVGLAIPV